MDRSGGLRLHRLPAEELRVHRVDSFRLHSRGSQVRSESNHASGRDSREIVRASTSRSEDHVARDAVKEEVSVSAVSTSPSELRSLEEFVQQDLDAFWRWCATPIDGLHRCGLLVKLLDYSGILEKASEKVRKLNSELHALGVCATDQVEPHQRVPYEAFVQSRRLREAVQSCTGNKFSREKRSGRPSAGQTPLAVWVLNVISLESKGFLGGRPERHVDSQFAI